MIAEGLKQLEADLWEAADQLRANSKLTATEYTMPILGLIFLRHATNRFEQIKAEVEPTLPVHPKRGRRPINRDDFWAKGAIFLPAEAHFDYLVGLPDNEDIGAKIDAAMRLVEEENETLKGVLPKTYTSFEKSLLLELLRIFNKEALRKATGDVFGKIYEYFLNAFAIKGAQEGGEFFTPISLVSTIVNFLSLHMALYLILPAEVSAWLYKQGISLRHCTKTPTNKLPFTDRRRPVPMPILPR